MTRLSLTALMLAASVPMSMPAWGDADYPPGRPFMAIEDDFDALNGSLGTIGDDVSGIKDDIAGIKTDIGDIKSDLGALTDVLTVELVVDTAVCATLPVQCGGPAFDNGVAADDGNANPVHLVAAVSRGGAPVTGLTMADFAYQTGTVPAGGSAQSFCDAVDCTASTFGEVAPGLYRMFLVIFDLSDWDAGTYTGTLSVADPAGGSGLALVSYTIPNAPI